MIVLIQIVVKNLFQDLNGVYIAIFVEKYFVKNVVIKLVKMKVVKN